MDHFTYFPERQHQHHRTASMILPDRKILKHLLTEFIAPNDEEMRHNISNSIKSINRL